jgi:hypothetical protein
MEFDESAGRRDLAAAHRLAVYDGHDGCGDIAALTHVDDGSADARRHFDAMLGLLNEGRIGAHIP